MPSGSAEAGPWQRGDADPSRRKEPFNRPVPVPISPPPVQETKLEAEPMAVEGQVHAQMPTQGQFAEAEGQVPPPREAIFVTRYVKIAHFSRRKLTFPASPIPSQPKI